VRDDAVHDVRLLGIVPAEEVGRGDPIEMHAVQIRDRGAADPQFAPPPLFGELAFGVDGLPAAVRPDDAREDVPHETVAHERDPRKARRS